MIFADVHSGRRSNVRVAKGWDPWVFPCLIVAKGSRRQPQTGECSRRRRLPVHLALLLSSEVDEITKRQRQLTVGDCFLLWQVSQRQQQQQDERARRARRLARVARRAAQPDGQVVLTLAYYQSVVVRRRSQAGVGVIRRLDMTRCSEQEAAVALWTFHRSVTKLRSLLHRYASQCNQQDAIAP